jgi:hypothetical protein
MAGPRPDAAAAPGVTLGCGHCGASLVMAGVRSQVCPYCASPNVVERPPAADQPTPALIVAFAGDAAAARGQLARWLGRRAWLVDRRLRRARVEALHGIYVPAYLYSAVADTAYTASIGEHYLVSEPVPVRGRPPRVPGVPGLPDEAFATVETRQVTRIEHRPLAGRHLAYVTDVLVSASRGLADDELRAIEPFDWRAARRFASPLVAGWLTEEASRDAAACARAGRAAALDEVGLRLRRFLPGDSHNDLTWQTALRWEAIDPVLVPVWVLAVRYRGDRPPLRLVINGQTGAVTGALPLAWGRIALALLGLAALIGALIWGAR